jgi:hypothetical protein
MEPPTKTVKRALRQLAARAHEEELRRALLPIAAAFGQWQAGQLGSGELTEIIHAFHQGAARELWKKYNLGPLEFAVAQAILAGVIERDQVPPDVLLHCRGALEYLAARAGD